MKLTSTSSCLALAAAVALLAGCNTTATKPAPTPPAAPVHILAYVNVSSGCQQATVDFLHGLPAKYPSVKVELVDFGDGGPGAERWDKSGLKCMALEIDGKSVVKFAHGEQMKVAAFRAPAGFYWTHEDFEQAVQAALAGKLQPATEEEFAAADGSVPTETDVEKYRAAHQSKGKPAAPAH